MAADKIIHGRININNLKKEWFFQGEKGLYIDFTIFYNEQQDEMKQNGMIVQAVPRKIYEAEKKQGLDKKQMTQGPILGNCVNFATANRSAESMPGYTGQQPQQSNDPFAGAGGAAQNNDPFAQTNKDVANMTTPNENLPF
jgi:hypothetical protein